MTDPILCKEKKVDYSPRLKKKIGQWLKSGAQRGARKILADALDVDQRTLYNWSRSCDVRIKRGRRPKKVRLVELKIIRKEWQRQGYCGSLAIEKALPTLRVKLIRYAVAGFKKKLKSRALKNKIKVQVRTCVKKVGAVVAMDGATLQRGEDILVLRDRASLKVETSDCDGSLTALNTIEVLKDLKEKNRLPLVLCTDNGSPFCANKVQFFLEN